MKSNKSLFFILIIITAFALIIGFTSCSGSTANYDEKYSELAEAKIKGTNETLADYIKDLSIMETDDAFLKNLEFTEEEIDSGEYAFTSFDLYFKDNIEWNNIELDKQRTIAEAAAQYCINEMTINNYKGYCHLRCDSSMGEAFSWNDDNGRMTILGQIALDNGKISENSVEEYKYVIRDKLWIKNYGDADKSYKFITYDKLIKLNDEGDYEIKARGLFEENGGGAAFEAGYLVLDSGNKISLFYYDSPKLKEMKEYTIKGGYEGLVGDYPHISVLSDDISPYDDINDMIE